MRSWGGLRMHLMGIRRRAAVLVIVTSLFASLAVVFASQGAGAATFTSSAGITLNNPASGSTGCTVPSTLCNAPASPYPSNITVSGLTGTVSSVSVTLTGVTYAFTQDIDALLVGPGGQNLVVVGNLGPDGAPAQGDPSASNATVTFSDAGSATTSQSEQWGTGNTYKPTDYSGFNESFESPAPASPWGNPGPATTAQIPGLGSPGATFASQFDGANPNGTWSLYVITNSAGDGTGSISGWSLNVTSASAASSTTTLASSVNPSFTSGANSSVVLTAEVTSTSTVNTGTVDFTDGGVTISGCGSQPVTAGAATCTTTFTTEGDHALEALYSGVPGSFAASHGSLTQQVNDPTTVTGSSYCNTGSITLNNPAVTLAGASPYPSRVFVSGLSGSISQLTVALKGVTYAESQDIDALVVGPTGQTFILVAAAGPNSSGGISNVTLTLSDSAATSIQSSAIWGSPSASVTSKPVNYGGVNETFGAPAPTGPYGNPGPAGSGTDTLGSTFDGTNPNGTWSLYVITTAAGDGTGSFSGGWCANITTANVTPTVTALTSSHNPSFTTAPTNGVAFTATVSPVPDGGTVNFTSKGVTIAGCGAQPLTSGKATCDTAFTVEGSPTIEALYSGDANYGASNASVTQEVDDHTTVTSNTFCNSGAITLNNPDINNPEIGASPYPSRIFISGKSGDLLHLAVTLKNVSYAESQDIDALLAGPSGQTLVLVAAAGPNSSGALSNVTLTLDDSATGTLAASSFWGFPSTTVSSKPVNYGGLNQSYGSAAPAGPYGNPGPFGGGSATLGSTFNGTSPDGTWSLYVITTAAGDGTGSIAGGWCLNPTTPSPPVLTTSFGASSIPLQGTTSLSFTVTNPNASSSLSGIGFTDTLPSGLVVATPNGETGSCGGGTIDAVAGGTAVSLSGATLGDSATCTFSVNVTGTLAGSQTNTTSAVTSNEGGPGSAATATVVVVAPPSLTKSFGASNIGLGATTSLTFTVTNPNASSSLSGIGFTDTLPSGLVISTPNGESGSCGGGTITASAGGNEVDLSGATVAGGTNCTFSINVTATALGSQVNTTSSISSIEGGTGAAATATLNVVQGVPQIGAAFGASTIPLNGTTSLTFTLTNPSGNGSATAVGFTDTLPSGMVVASPNGVTGSCGGGTITADAGTSTVSLSGATLADGANCTFSVNVMGSLAGLLSNSVTDSSSAGTGNTATASLTVVAPPVLNDAFAASTMVLGSSTTLTFFVSNPNANTDLTGIGFTDTLPAGLVVSTPNGEVGGCAFNLDAVAGGNTISLTGLIVAANQECTFSVDVTAVALGTQVNTTSAVSSNEGGNGAAPTATVLVSPAPPAINTAFGAATIPLNSSTSLSFTIGSPTGSGSQSGIGFTDTLPSGLVVATPNGLTGSCDGGTITAAAGSGTVTLAGATLADGANCSFSVNVTGTMAGTKNNSVTVSSTEGGTGNTDLESIVVVAPPTIGVAFGASSIPEGGSTSLTFTLTNPNTTSALSGLAFTDTLPAGLVVSTPNGLTGSCGGGTFTAVAGGNVVSLTGGTLVVSGQCTFSVNVTATAAGSQVDSTGPLDSTEGGTGTAGTATLVVVAPPVIALAFGSSSVSPGGSTSLTFTITNPAVNAVALTGVAFSDTLPSGLVVSSPNGLTGSCGGGTITAVAGSSSVSLSGALLAASGSCTFSVNVTGTTTGVKTDSAMPTSTNGGTGIAASATLTVLSPPQIAIVFGATSVPLNGSTSLTFMVSNPNASDALNGIAFTDTLPAGLVVSTPNGLTGSCGGGAIGAAAGSGLVSLGGATLAGGASCTFSVNVTGSAVGVQIDSVTVTSTNAGTGNTPTATITVVGPPGISVSFGSATIALGGSTTLTFTVSNPNATTTLSGIAFTDTLPSGLVVSTPNGLTGSCGGGSITAVAGSGSVALSGAVLSASASCTFSVNVVGTTSGVKNNSTGPVASTEGGNGTAGTASITVVGPPVIGVTFGATTIPVGGSTTLTFTINNPNTTTTLTGVGFTDTLPSGLVVSTPNGLIGSCGGGTISAGAGSSTVSLTGAALAASASCTVRVNVTGLTPGVKSDSTGPVTSVQAGSGSAAGASVTVTAISLSPTTLPNGANGVLYGQTITASGGTGPYTFTFTGTLPPGLTLSSAGLLRGTPTTAGSFMFTVTATQPGGGSGSQSYTLTVLAAIAPSTTTISLNGCRPFSLTFTTGAPGYSFAVASGSLPPGMTLSAGGVLSGTPTSSGSFSVTISATAAGSPVLRRSYVLTVGLCIGPSSGVLTSGSAGQPYSYTLTTTGGTSPYRYLIQSGALPTGLTMSQTGVISGTPTVRGTYTVTIDVVDSSQAEQDGQGTFTIIIN